MGRDKERLGVSAQHLESIKMTLLPFAGHVDLRSLLIL